MLEKGASADIDRFRLADILVYRTLVLRRGPAASRPPSVYQLVWSRRYYEVWQRPVSGAPRIVEHLSLGNASEAAGVPRCSEVLGLARLATGGSLITATRPRAIRVTSAPSSGTVTVRVTAPSSGRYIAWLGGDCFGLASVSVDGRKIGSKREELNWPGIYTDLGSVSLSAGPHRLAMTYGTGGWHPGSGGKSYAFGPLLLSRADSQERLVAVSPSAARSLCGRRLDWIEAVR